MHKGSPADMCLQSWGKQGNRLAKFKIGSKVIFTSDNKIHEILGINPLVCQKSDMEYIITDYDYPVWESELTLLPDISE